MLNIALLIPNIYIYICNMKPYINRVMKTIGGCLWQPLKRHIMSLKEVKMHSLPTYKVLIRNTLNTASIFFPEHPYLESTVTCKVGMAEKNGHHIQCNINYLY